MKNKKGQIVIFMILGILLLLIFAGIFYLTSKRVVEDVSLDAKSEISEINFKNQIVFFTETCIENKILPGISLLGVQGGIIYPPENTKAVLFTENAMINYGYVDGTELISKKVMEEHLEGYLLETLPECLNDYEVFQEQGIKFPNIKIDNDKIIVDVSYDGDFKKADSEVSITNYRVEIPYRVGAVLKEAQRMIERQKANGKVVIFGASTDNRYFVSYFPYDEEIMIFSISDGSILIDEIPFVLMFAYKETKLNTPPELDYIQDFVVRKGNNLTYQLLAIDNEDDSLFFSSNSIIVPVSQNGVINTVLQDVGTYIVKFAVEDYSGLKDEQEIRVVVEE
jgi:hypothetical protein